MILPQIVFKIEADQSIWMDILPEFIAALVAFLLGLSSNIFFSKREKRESQLKEDYNLRMKLRAVAENYFLFRIEREQCLSLIKTYKILADYSILNDKDNFKKLMHDYMIREQDIKLKCHNYHAEMRSIASMIYPFQSKLNELNDLLKCIQVLAQEINYDFKKWEKSNFYADQDEANRLRKEYSDKVLVELNMHLHTLQEKVKNAAS
jgi:hypothetical protein